MLEKEVIKHTRDGIQKQNLVTGKSEMLIQSDYAKQTHYNRPYTTNYSHIITVRNSSSSTRSLSYKEKHSFGIKNHRVKTTQEKLLSTSLYHTSKESCHNTSFSTLNAKSNSLLHTNTSVPGNNPNIFMSSPTISRHRLLGFARSFSNRLANNTVRKTAKNLKKNDNIGLQAVGEYTEKIQTTVRGYRYIKKFIKNKHLKKIENIRRSSLQLSTWKSAATNKAALQRAKSLRNQVQGLNQTRPLKLASKVVNAILSIPGSKTIVVVCLVIFFFTLFMNQAINAFVNSFVGSTIDHPELTAYVEQLDRDFQQKVNSEKEKYSDKPNTTVKIEWDGFVDTDANVLAILITKDWTVLDLTTENKATLKKYHSILNTFDVEKESGTEQTITDEGEVKKERSHKITIRVHIYTAEDVIDSLGFTEPEKFHVIEMLDVLKQISDSSSPTTGIIITDGDGLFTWPAPGVTTITSAFGARWGKQHKGIDISGNQSYGKPIVAAADGVITQAVHSGWGGGYGLCAYIDHSEGYSTRYGHCSKVLVNKGDHVKKGQVIAFIGSSGDSTGAHLHFEIRKNGVPIDPQKFLK